MRKLIVVSSAIGAALLVAACGHSTTPAATAPAATAPAAATTSAAAKPTSPASCHAQYEKWESGPVKAIASRLNPALAKLQAAGQAGDTSQVQAALRPIGPLATASAAYPIPRCADPKGYDLRLLALLRAASDAANSAGGPQAMLTPLEQIPAIQAKLRAELKTNAGVLS